jgi:hypothetical protein
MSAVATPAQAVASGTVTFNVIIVDTCVNATISFIAPAAMTHTVTSTAATQVAVSTDSISNSLATTGVCGSFTYTNTEAYPWLTIDQATATITVLSTNMADIGPHTVTLRASLTNYPSAPPVSVTFTVTMVDPCLTTVLSLPTLSTFTISAFDGIGNSQTFTPLADTASTAAS